MVEADDRLMEWLRDAHAMEQQAEQMLSALIGRIQHYTGLKARLQQHLEETRKQVELVEACIRRRGGTTSTLKDIGGKTVAMAQGLSGMFVSDEVVKGVLASYAFEHMEIGSYRILAAGAEALGDAETKRVCEAILREEEAMAAWLLEHMDEITGQFLMRAEAPGVAAKR